MNNIKYFTLGKCGYSTNRDYIGAWIQLNEKNYELIKSQMDGILSAGFEKNKGNFLYHIIEISETSKIQVPYSNGLLKKKVTGIKLVLFDNPNKYHEFMLINFGPENIPMKLYHKDIYNKKESN